ncbi:MoxR family ATPase [Curtobacterium sp. MCBD17_035]|uniref:AAA family ATPase n=1 Tax=Curtobacterium sp. MCBD17_035 TaxID=2175673 RepID=UPI0021ABFA07|nr:MoxR family ATPase [Curtobacterium sp. MCBD17_035]WIB67620.1 MoxR family ATPase [Curtobacterium sp. MCBD17_035]
MTDQTADTTTPSPLSVAEVARLSAAVLDAVGTAVVGMREPLELAFASILAGGHVLFEDVPGLGKTLAARSLAQASGLDFRRLQCTPDLLPADITGSFVYAPSTAEFVFRPGPVFTGLFLADEINRTSPKTQSALLEAMAEGQVTVEGDRFPLPRPFHVVATSNPIEYEGTYALPEAQLDRFMVRLAAGYPSRTEEQRVLLNRVERQREVATVPAVISGADLLRMQATVEQVHVDEDIALYCVDLAVGTREHRDVQVGASPRGAQALLLVGRARAVMAGRDFVTPEDVKTAAVPVLAHRLSLTPQAWANGVDPATVVRTVAGQVAGPPAVASGRGAGTGGGIGTGRATDATAGREAR